jgi:hypothetical protein
VNTPKKWVTKVFRIASETDTLPNFIRAKVKPSLCITACTKCLTISLKILQSIDFSVKIKF